MSGLPMGDVSLPPWLCLCDSKIGEEGSESWPLSPWADGLPEALLRWAEAKDLPASDRRFPWGSAWLGHNFLEVVGSTPWRHRQWHSLRMGGSVACYARHPQLQLFLWLGKWHNVGTALRYATAFQDAAIVGPVRLPQAAGASGATTLLTHLEVPSGGRGTASVRISPPVRPKHLSHPPRQV